MATIKAGIYKFNDILTFTTSLEQIISFNIDLDLCTTDGLIDSEICSSMSIGQTGENNDKTYLKYFIVSYTTINGTADINEYEYVYDESSEDFGYGWELDKYKLINITEDVDVSSEFATWFNANAVKQDKPVHAVEITYKNATITVDTGKTIILRTTGKKMTEDLVINSNETVKEYGGNVTITGEPSYTPNETPNGGTTECSGDHVIEVAELPTENIDENALYKMGDSYYKGANECVDLFLVQDGEAMSYTEALSAEGASLVLFTVDKYEDVESPEFFIDTDNMILYFYYDVSRNDMFGYYDEWISLSVLFEATNGGTITNASEATEEGYYYALVGGWEEYGNGSRVVEVTELPTENIDKKNLYKYEGSYYEYENEFSDIIIVSSDGTTSSLVETYTSAGYSLILSLTDDYETLAPRGSTSSNVLYCSYDTSRDDIYVYDTSNEVWVPFSQKFTAYTNGGAVDRENKASVPGCYYALYVVWKALGAAEYAGEVVIE